MLLQKQARRLIDAQGGVVCIHRCGSRELLAARSAARHVQASSAYLQHLGPTAVEHSGSKAASGPYCAGLIALV